MFRFGSILLVLALVPFGAFAGHTPAHAAEQIQAQINALLAQVEELQAQLAAQAGSAAPPSECPVITRTLYRGLRDTTTEGEVSELQKFLAQDFLIYPERSVTGYYGLLTERAVQKFQAREGVVSSGSPATTGYGVVGPKTRTKIAEVCARAGNEATPLPLPAAQSVTVLSPEAEAVLTVGAAHLIRWSTLGEISAVDLLIAEWTPRCTGDALCGSIGGLTPVYTIARNVPNTGSFSWTVGRVLEANSLAAARYVVRVRASAAPAVIAESGLFAFTLPNATPTLNVISFNNEGVSVPRGVVTPILWNTSSSIMRVNLSVRGGGTTYPFATNLPNEGLFLWQAGKDKDGSDIPAGSYTLRAQDAQSALFDESDATFQLK